jgi:hydrogenase maturation protein HypF
MGQGWAIRVTGFVQGVGFRPHVWRVAHDLGVRGQVLNDGQGVLIRLWCDAPTRDQMMAELRAKAPPLARIETMTVAALALDEKDLPDGFEIIASASTEIKTGIVPEAATCPLCVAETLDENNRRYLYPFTNCTHCGPRFTIIKKLPYDRSATTMAPFTMCSDCQSEYDDPANRRFHAQPNACPICGPTVWLEGRDGERLAGDGTVLAQAAELLTQGHILAIKGIGGFHLACDATNQQAVATLRHRKRRPTKPLAVMVKDMAMARTFADVNEQEAAALAQVAAPIVLLDKKASVLAPNIAQGNQKVGLMLPYSPLHHVLFHHLDIPLVMTSANRSHEPQVIDNQVARETLGDIVEYYVMHDRAIENRIDDSVVRVNKGRQQVMRRARGFAPLSVAVPDGFKTDVSILAAGPDLKNTFSLCTGGQVIVSQHMGDQDNLLAHDDYRKNIALYGDLYDCQPDVIAHDAHPDYQPTKWAQTKSVETGAELVAVQHHHAHVAAVMAEYGMALDHPKVLGIVLDGMGLSLEGEIWGGEFLYADYHGFERLAHIPAIPLIGGDQAMKQPWRNLYAHLVNALGWDQVTGRFGGLEVIQQLAAKQLRLCDQMMEKGLNSPLASSAGRLFDSVAAALGICFDQITYEGEAAIVLEQLAMQTPTDAILYDIAGLENWSGLWSGILADLAAGVAASRIAGRFHRSLAAVLCSEVAGLAFDHPFQHVVLTGGVFQNSLLLNEVRAALSTRGFEVCVPHDFPANDGGLSLGQTLVVLAGR